MDYTRDRPLQLELTQVDTWLNRVLDEQAIPDNIVCVRELTSGGEVPLDHEHLRRAIINIVDNAVAALQEKAPPCGEEKLLTVSTRVAGQRLAIQISDTGCGIPDDLLDKIFEPLFSTKTFGVGLGMPIVRKIMQQHGGGVEIQNKAGADCGQSGGTMVTLWLPIPNSNIN